MQAFAQSRNLSSGKASRSSEFQRPHPRTTSQTSDSGRLVIGGAGDRAEREADHISEKALQSRTYLVQEGFALGRQTDPACVNQIFKSSGEPLDSGTRDLLEPRLGFDLGRVRIHADHAAAENSLAVSARAFALGNHIAFGHDQYSPGTSDGIKLLAHELVHVMQYAESPAPVLLRSPLLAGKANQEFGDSDAALIDKAIAESPIKDFIPVKELKKLAGNVDTEDPVVFEKQFEKYQKSHKDVETDASQVPGFVDREAKKPIKLRLPGKSSKGDLVRAATFEAAVHEVLHLNSHTDFQNHFGHNYNEGVTEHFSELVLGESGKAYREQIKLADGLISALGADGEKQVGKAFFKGDKEPYRTILDGFRQMADKRGLMKWQQSAEKKPPDVTTANQLLKDALSTSSTPAAVQTAPAKGEPGKTAKPEK
jgi:hypothetical protein